MLYENIPMISRNYNKPVPGGQKGIISLVTVFVVGLLGLGIMITLSTMGFLEINKNINTKSGSQTFYTAEAAAREGIYQYLKDESVVSGSLTSPLNSIPESDISFAVYSSPRGWAYREIEGRAENTLTNRIVKSTLLLFPSGAVFDYAIYSEYNLNIKGSVDIVGDIFSGGIISCSGNKVHIEGNAYSVGDDVNNTCEDNASSTYENTDIISPPDINPDYYRDIALVSGCASTPDNVKNDCLSVPTTSVVFVKDPINPAKETKLQGIDLAGNLTVVGNLWISGNSSITATNDYAVIVVKGNLKITGDNIINGIVYVSGTTTFGAGNTTLNGSLISKGGTATDLNGNVTINYDAPLAPPGGIDDSGAPKIVSWSEE
jgi:cytoskeletal protein CcmA (bactofilin family)